MIKPANRLYAVYKHTNKINGKVYIGITCQAPERRWQKGAGYARTYFGQAIKKYGWDAFTHEVIETGLEETVACEREIALISKFHSNEREHGYNLSGGGEVTDCIAPRTGGDSPKAVAVVRIDTDTGERKVFPSVADASREMNINHRGISKACCGVAKTYKGYVWEYANKEFQKPNRYAIGKYPHIHQQKPIKMTDAHGQAYYFKSIGEATEYIGAKSHTTVSRYVLGLRKDATGRRWEYA